jgi:hypothetical protein
MKVVTDKTPELICAPQVVPQRPRRLAAVAGKWQTAWLVLMAALTMNILEGAFRKWVPGFGEGIGKYLMYFSKDIIFAGLLLFPRRAKISPALTTFGNWLLPGCFLLGVGAFLSSLHGLNIVGAILTTRACVILPVLALLAVPRLAGLPLRWPVRLLIALTLLNFALGVEQNRLPAGHFLNRYAAVTENIVATPTGVRAAGTFSYITGLTLLSPVGVWAGLALMGLARTQRQRIGAWVAVAAGFGCGLAAVSRGPIVIDLAMVLGWFFLSKENISAAGRILFSGIFCVVIAAGFGITPIFSDLGEGLLERTENSGDTLQDRAFGQFGDIVTVSQSAPLGRGFGIHQSGGVYAEAGAADLNTLEGPLPRMILETGIIGLMGYFFICAGALLALQRAKRTAPSTGARAALLATQLLLLPFFYGSVLFNHTASAFVWMIFAAVLAAAELNTKQDAMPRRGVRLTRSERLRPEAQSLRKPYSL